MGTYFEHELKLHPKYFNRIQDGTKTFEIRKNDRDFQVGDRLLLREFDPEKGWPDHGCCSAIVAEITYFATEFQQPGYCVLGIKVLEPAPTKDAAGV